MAIIIKIITSYVAKAIAVLCYWTSSKKLSIYQTGVHCCNLGAVVCCFPLPAYTVYHYATASTCCQVYGNECFTIAAS